MSSDTTRILVNLNGRLMRPEEAKVSVFDRGYLYGDSLYEVVRSYRGRIFGLDEHLLRLERSSELCHMVLGQKPAEYASEIHRTFEQWKRLPGNEDSDSYCRLIVSRGEGKIGFGLSCLTTPTLFTIIVQPLDPMPPEEFRKGRHLQVSARLRNDPRALDPAMKSGNYLNSLLAYLEAAAGNFDDALLCNGEGHVTEGTTFNVFYARRGIIATPPLEIGILDGITRRTAIELARGLGCTVREVRFPKERLYEADEVFMTSSTKDVFPVTRIDGRKISSGAPGEFTRRLHDAFEELMQKTLARAGA